MVEFYESGRDCTIEEKERSFESKGACESANRLSLSAMLATSAAVLAACGGGGGGGARTGAGLSSSAATSDQAALADALAGRNMDFGSLASLEGTQTASTYAYLVPRTDEEAARFLLQAQSWATDADITAVRSQGYIGWLASKLDAPKAQTGWEWLAGKDYNAVTFDSMVWSQLMASPDGLRKRLALALSEIFVVSGTEIGSNWPDLMMAQYWDTLVAGVTGNFRNLLEAISLNPAMGYFLNTKGNRKADESGGKRMRILRAS